MKSILYLSGKSEEIISDDLPKEWFEGDEGDMSSLYTFVCDQFPDNDWEDISCNSVTHKPNHIEVHLTVA